MINYSLATNWDNELIHKVSELTKAYDDASVVEFFGSHQTSVVGTGRPAHRLQEVDDEKMRSHIGLIHKHGFSFNYTLNGIINDFDAFLENNEKDLINLLGQLTSLEVDSITVSSEDLIKYIRANYKHFKIVVSLITGIDTAKDAKRLEKYGVETITLNPHTINKHFDRLKQIREAVDCKLQLYANIPCLKDCPYCHDHYNLFSGQSREIPLNGRSQDKFLQWCSYEYIKNPENFLTSPFIRPDEVEYYHESIGINSFKLSDRSESTSFLVKTAMDYLSKATNDLFRLVYRDGRKIKYSIKNTKFESLMNTPIPITLESDNDTQVQEEHCKNSSRIDKINYKVNITDTKKYKEFLSALRELNKNEKS